MSYTVGDFTISRWSCGTCLIALRRRAAHPEKIDSTTLFDLDLTWSRPIAGLRNVDCSLSFINLFDTKYVSMISASDYKTLKTSYQPGAPFTVVASVAIHY